MTNPPTPPYTEATVELVADALRAHCAFCRGLSSACPGHANDATSALNALVKAGLLLPEGAETQYAVRYTHAGATTEPLSSRESAIGVAAGIWEDEGIACEPVERWVGPWRPISTAEGGGEADHPNASQDRADDEVNHV